MIVKLSFAEIGEAVKEYVAKHYSIAEVHSLLFDLCMPERILTVGLEVTINEQGKEKEK